jgi:Kef-type K+ transport system membrane component KefB
MFAGLAAMLGAALLLVKPLRRLGMPALIAEIAAGIALGPTIFGTVAPDLHAHLFPTTGDGAVAREAVVRFGLVMLLVLAGLEVEFTHVARHRKAVVLVSLLGSLIPFAGGFGMVSLAPAYWTDGNVTSLALVTGTILSISALPVIARILFDNGLLATPIGSVSMSAAAIGDLIGWALFAAIVGRYGGGVFESTDTLTQKALLVFGLGALTMTLATQRGRKVLSWVRRRFDESESYIPLVLVVIFVAAAVAEGIGTHAIFGGFIVGAALSGTNEAKRQLTAALTPLTLQVLAPLYLISIGLKVNFATSFDLGLFGLVLAVASLGKLLGAGLGARWGGLPVREALTIGVAMNARGAMGIVLTAAALDYQLIDERVFVALTLMAVATTLVSAVAIPRFGVPRGPGR